MKYRFFSFALAICFALAITSCKSSKSAMTDAPEVNAPSTPTTTQRTSVSKDDVKAVPRETRQRPSGIVQQSQINESLGLTDKQSDQLQDIQKNYRKKMDALKKEGRSTSDRAALMNEIKSLKEQENTEIQAVLSKEQYTQYIEMKMERGNRGQVRNMPRKNAGKMAKGNRKGYSEADREAKYQEKLVKDLELSADQTLKYNSIQEKYAPQFEESKEDANIIQGLETSKNAEIKAVLSSEQYVRYEAAISKRKARKEKMQNRIKDQRKNKMEGGKVRRSGDKNNFDKIASELKMDEEQTEKFTAINAKYKAEMKAISGDRTQIMSGMEKLRTAKLAEIEELLSAEQFLKYNQLVKDMRKKGFE